jgi:ribosomal protein S18 acetylase RimI-like enzyme
VPGRRRPGTTPRMHIRRAVAADVTAVSAVVVAAYSRYVPRIGREPAPMTADYASLVADGDVWVGETDGRVLGVLVIRASGDVLELENVAVDPHEQRLGHGRALVSFAESHARERGLTAVELYTNEAMAENIELYPRLGYIETGRHLEDGYRRVYFRKTLDSSGVRR